MRSVLIGAASTVVFAVALWAFVVNTPGWAQVQSSFFDLDTAIAAFPRVGLGFLVNLQILAFSVVGVAVGLILGTAYGFVGANSILGSQYFGPPLLPPVFLVALVVGALAFGAVASLAPGRRASRIAPAIALREA